MAKKVQIQNILLKEIDTESFQNARSGKWKENNGDENAVAQFEDFRKNIRANGQLTAVLVRATGKSRKPYELIAGWRRFAALEANAEESGDKEPTIKAEIKELSNFEARKLHGVENFAREDLSVPDQVWEMGQFLSEASAANVQLDDAGVGAELGISQAYAGRLGKIARNVAPKLIKHWRESSVNPLTLEEMGQVADVMEPGPQAELYNTLQIKRDKKKETSVKGPGAWIETAQKQAYSVGQLLGLLVMLEQISPDALKFDSDFLTLLVKEAKMVKLGKKGNDAKARSKIVSALKAGYKAGQQPRDDKEEDTESEAAE